MVSLSKTKRSKLMPPRSKEYVAAGDHPSPTVLLVVGP